MEVVATVLRRQASYWAKYEGRVLKKAMFNQEKKRWVLLAARIIGLS